MPATLAFLLVLMLAAVILGGLFVYELWHGVRRA